MKAQGDRVVQSWLIAAVGLLALGMLWIVFSLPNGGSPIFGGVLFAAGVLTGIVAVVLRLLRG